MKCSNSSLCNKRLIFLIDIKNRNSPRLQKLAFISKAACSEILISVHVGR